MILVVAVMVSLGTLINEITPRQPETGARVIGIALARSADGTKWTLTFTSVPSGLTASGTKLAIITSGGSTALAAKLFNVLTYFTDGAGYVLANPGVAIGVGDRLLMNATAYPTGFWYQILDDLGFLASGSLRS